MPSQLSSVGSILEVLTGILEIEYLKKQKSVSNEYDTTLKGLEDVVAEAKSRTVNK